MSRQIDTETLRRWLDERRPVTVIDIRNDEARSQWSIPGSVHVNAYDDLREGRPGRLATTHLREDRPVVAVCYAGRVSQTAADILRRRGFDARSLTGGMKAWSLAWNEAEVPLTNRAVRAIQIRRTGKGCLSYIVACGSDAVVIDPSLPPRVYLDVMRGNGWRLRHVLETHVHADHLSRARVLADLADATVLLPDQERVQFPFTAVHGADVIEIGSARMVVLPTPGHTDESVSYVIDGAVFTGDTLFLRGVGRPDLHANPAGARRRAHALFVSLSRLRTLPAGTVVLPAHTSEAIPFDRQPIAARRGEIESCLAEWLASEEAFVERVLAGVPETPPNFSRIIALNEAGDPFDGDPTELEAGANRCAVAVTGEPSASKDHRTEDTNPS